jgi:hypothetical protein
MPKNSRNHVMQPHISPQGSAFSQKVVLPNIREADEEH